MRRTYRVTKRSDWPPTQEPAVQNLHPPYDDPSSDTSLAEYSEEDQDQGHRHPRVPP